MTNDDVTVTLVAALALAVAVSFGGCLQRPSSKVSGAVSDTLDLSVYEATPPEVVQRMLALAKVTSTDVVYDLGCGDGRIVIAAARGWHARRAVGIDIDGGLIRRAISDAIKDGVSDRVSFREQDALKADIHEASVVTLYLPQTGALMMRPKLTSELKVGARVVSHNVGMADWAPEAVDRFLDDSGRLRTLYVWTIDGIVRL